MHLDRQFC